MNGEFSLPLKKAGGEKYGVSIECPECRKEMEINRGGAFCDDCGIRVWRKVAGKSLTDEQLKELVEKRKLEGLSGFRSRKGKTFRADLILNRDYEVEFLFPEKKRRRKKDEAVDH